MKSAVFQLSISSHADAEEAVVALVGDLFGGAPSVYTDADTGKTTASVFLTKRSEWTKSKKKELQIRLKLLRAAGVDPGPGRIHFKTLKRQDWAESWKKHFKPIQVGKALLIKPSWSRLRARRGQACVILDPGLSFGTGQHATTLFCLEQIVRCRRADERQSFLDMGTGSGILAISAAKLGYSPVQAFDFDPEAVRISRINADQNNVLAQVRTARCDLTKLPLHSKTKFDLICANLIYDLLLSERERIVNRLEPSGSLILAGILKTQFAQVKSAYEEIGMTLKRTKTEKEWQSGQFIFQSGFSRK